MSEVRIKANGIPPIRICDIFKYSDNFLTLKEFSEFQKFKEFFDSSSPPSPLFFPWPLCYTTQYRPRSLFDKAAINLSHTWEVST
jgi:hypothetical protein